MDPTIGGLQSGVCNAVYGVRNVGVYLPDNQHMASPIVRPICYRYGRYMHEGSDRILFGRSGGDLNDTDLKHPHVDLDVPAPFASSACTAAVSARRAAKNPSRPNLEPLGTAETHSTDTHITAVVSLDLDPGSFSEKVLPCSSCTTTTPVLFANYLYGFLKKTTSYQRRTLPEESHHHGSLVTRQPHEPARVLAYKLYPTPP